MSVLSVRYSDCSQRFGFVFQGDTDPRGSGGTDKVGVGVGRDDNNRIIDG